jgi:hypothetical protein
MGVFLGIVDSIFIETKHKNLLSWLPRVLTDLVCLTSSVRVPCQAWETSNWTEYNYYIVRPKHWHGLQRLTKFPIKNNIPIKSNVFREAWFTQVPIKKNSLGNRNKVSPLRFRGLVYHSGLEFSSHNNESWYVPVSFLSDSYHLVWSFKPLEVLWKHTVTILMKLNYQNCLHTTITVVHIWLYVCVHLI